MRELGDARTLRVDLLRFLGFYFGLERRCRGRFFDACNRPPPRGPGSGWRALLAQRPIAADLFRWAIHACTYTVSAIQDRAWAQRFSRGAAENILRSIEGK